MEIMQCARRSLGVQNTAESRVPEPSPRGAGSPVAAQTGKQSKEGVCGQDERTSPQTAWGTRSTCTVTRDHFNTSDSLGQEVPCTSRAHFHSPFIRSDRVLTWLSHPDSGLHFSMMSSFLCQVFCCQRKKMSSVLNGLTAWEGGWGLSIYHLILAAQSHFMCHNPHNVISCPHQSSGQRVPWGEVPPPATTAHLAHSLAAPLTLTLWGAPKQASF